MGRNKESDNVIRIHKAKLNDSHQLCSKNKIFTNEYIIISVFYDRIEITVPTIDYNGKMFKTSHNNKGINDWMITTILNDKINAGKFLIDEDESNEDIVVMYFEDQLD